MERKNIKKIILFATLSVSFMGASMMQIPNNITKKNTNTQLLLGSYDPANLGNEQYFHAISSYEAHSVGHYDPITLPKFIKAEHSKPFMHLVNGLQYPYFKVDYETRFWKKNKHALFYVNHYKMVNEKIQVLDYIMQKDDKYQGTFAPGTLSSKQIEY